MESESYKWAEYQGPIFLGQENMETYHPHTLTLKRHMKNGDYWLVYNVLQKIMDKCAETQATQDIYQNMLGVLKDEEEKKKKR